MGARSWEPLAIAISGLFLAIASYGRLPNGLSAIGTEDG